MAFPNVTLVYSVPVRGGGTVAQVQAAVRDAPVPIDELLALGVRVTSDNTTAADPVVRTLTLDVEPVAAAAATATLINDTSSVDKVTVTVPGSGYVAPPVVFFNAASEIQAHAQAFLKLVTLAVAQAGAGYSAQTTLNFIGGLAPGSARRSDGGIVTQNTKDPIVGPNCVGSVGIIDPGRGYDPATSVVEFLGVSTRPAQGIPFVDAQGRIIAIQMTDMGEGYVDAPEVVITGGDGHARLGANMMRGRAATATLTIVGGHITAVAIVDGGDGYVSLPTPIIFDPTGGGSGGDVTQSFGVGRVDVSQRGLGYQGAPPVLLIALFDSIFLFAINAGPPLSGTTLLPFVNLLTQAIQSRVATPVSVSLPS